MTNLGIFLINGIILLGSFSLLWLISLRRKDASIVDIAWGLSFVLAAGIYFWLSQDGYLARKLLVVCLVTIWGVRLSAHIYLRNRYKGEDFRYENWRRQHGSSWLWRSYLQVFLLQGLLAWFISLPLLIAQNSPIPDGLTAWDWIGCSLWAAGFALEALGDWQLARFQAQKQDPEAVLRSGLWQYSRHPNYFGEAVLWWGYGAIALSVPNGWLALTSPLLMTFLLTRVSGVRLLDKALLARKPAYEEYARSTSAFIPWFPKRTAPNAPEKSDHPDLEDDRESPRQQDSKQYN
jgi:steroid 5-alpha reductase family enzyme